MTKVADPTGIRCRVLGSSCLPQCTFPTRRNTGEPDTRIPRCECRDESRQRKLVRPPCIGWLLHVQRGLQDRARALIGLRTEPMARCDDILIRTCNRTGTTGMAPRSGLARSARGPLAPACGRAARDSARVHLLFEDREGRRSTLVRRKICSPPASRVRAQETSALAGLFGLCAALIRKRSGHREADRCVSLLGINGTRESWKQSSSR
jgi:hypothetical protein